ncbi:STAS domain-containing protein [Desulfocurvus sp. DL9XJH121]
MSIRIAGPCVVENASEVAAALLRGLAAGETEVDFSGVTDADLSFFQIIHALKKEAGAATLLPSLPVVFGEAARWCGLAEILTAEGSSIP